MAAKASARRETPGKLEAGRSPPLRGGAMSAKVKMSWTDWRGKEQVREFNQIIDIRDFLGSPGYSMLLVAANTDQSAPDIEAF